MASSIYLTGEAKAPSNNPSMTQYGLFFIAFEIEADTHRILDVDCSATLALTRQIIRDLFIGADITDTGRLTQAVTARHHGSSQNALIAAANSAAKKYRELPASG